MNAAPQTHPSPDQLAAFAQGRLAPVDQAVIERHVAACSTCCQVLMKVPDDTLVERLRQVNTPPTNAALRGGDTGYPDARPQDGPPPELAEHPRYRIIRSLGAGGMGVVYQAEHRLMERTVALKVVNRALTNHPVAVERFRQEVKAAARLAHANIVTAHDAEQAGDLHFLVMEYVEGVSLAALVLKRGALPVTHSCNYIRQAALGLQHAFEQGMVHRDIKPHNLMLTKKGQVKILDFGLARFVRERDAEVPRLAGAAPASASGITSVDAVLGTPDFIAPEQASSSRRADIRADIYSLGCTLYYLLAGQVPFPDGSSMEKLFAHVEQTARPLAELRNDVPAALLAVVQRMMAKDPAQRYQTPAEVAQALAPFSRATPGQVAGAGHADHATMVPVATLLPTGPQVQPESKPAGPRSRRLRRVVVGLIATALLTALVLLGKNAWFGARPVPATFPAAPVVAATGKVLFVLPPQNFWYFDYGPVRDVLQAGGIKVEVAASVRGPIRPDPRSGGSPVQPNMLLNEAKVADYDAIVLIGGDVMPLKSDPDVRRLVHETLAAKKYVAAICNASGLLADWGELRGKRATGPTWVQSRMAKENLAIPVDEPVVVSERIITGRGPDGKDGRDRPPDAPVFAKKLLDCLQGR